MKVGFSGYGQNERRFYYVKSIFLSKIFRSGLVAYFFNFPLHNLGPGFFPPSSTDAFLSIKWILGIKGGQV